MRRRLAAAALALAALRPAAAGDLPPGLVRLADVAPEILQDIRYASARNFVGRPLAGYGAAACILHRRLAEALAAAARELAARGLGLMVFDCYRPARAVADIARWAEGAEAGRKAEYFPTLDKSRLFALGFVARTSAHSRGTAVDLTLVPLGTSVTAEAAPTTRACHLPRPDRAPESGLDMGTGFDCFHLRAATAARDIAPEARANRRLLVEVLARHGLKNYRREWWHFQLAVEPKGARAYDAPIGP